MTLTSLLVANRGEIAIRITRAAADLGIRTVAVYSEDDAESLHTRIADDSRKLSNQGLATSKRPLAGCTQRRAGRGRSGNRGAGRSLRSPHDRHKYGGPGN